MSIYSSEHSLCFIHIPKTAGSSIAAWLIEHANAEHYQNKSWGAKHFDQKRTMLEMKKKNIVVNHWFTCVRNPWDRMVSTYSYYSRRKNMRDASGKLLTFDQFIHDEHPSGWCCSKKQQHAYFDSSITTVLRFENLPTDFKRIKELVNREGKLGHVNKSGHKNYRSYYNETTKAIVAKRCERDISLFEYTF